VMEATVNLIGAIATGVVAVVILTTKFSEGAWIVLVLMTLGAAGLTAVRRRYDSVARQLSFEAHQERHVDRQLAILLVPRVHRGIIDALEYARSLHADVRGLHVTLDRRTTPALRKQWEEHGLDVPLVVIDSPYRSLIDPTLEYIDQMLEEQPNRVITVIVSEAVARKWRHRLLQENVAQVLKRALGKRDNVVVSNYRYFLS